MNTPEPCCNCLNLYYDCMTKDDPDCYIECKLGLIIGNKKCTEHIPEFIGYTNNCPICDYIKDKPELSHWKAKKKIIKGYY